MDKINSEENKQFLHEIWEGKRKGAFAYAVPLYRTNPPSCDMNPRRYSNYETFMDKEKHLQSELEYVESRVRGRGNAVVALNTVTFGYGFLATAFGSTYDPVNNWTSQCITGPEEIKALKKPDLSSGLIPRVLERIQYFVDKTKGEIPIYLYDILGPVSVASMVMDDQELLIAMYTNPREVHRLLEMITALTIECIDAMKGIIPEYVPSCLREMYFPEDLGIAISDDWTAIISPNLYREFNVRYNNVISEHCGGLFLHSCGDIRKNLANLKSMKNLRGINFGASEVPFEDVAEELRGTDIVLVPHIGLNQPFHFGSRLEYARYIMSKKQERSSVFMLAYESNVPLSSLETFNEDSKRVIDYIEKNASAPGRTLSPSRHAGR